MKEFKTGVYQHFKGGKYLVLGIAKHSETLEDMVVYINLYENTRSNQNMWVRPLSMFEDQKELDGKMVNRFTYVGGF